MRHGHACWPLTEQRLGPGAHQRPGLIYWVVFFVVAQLGRDGGSSDTKYVTDPGPLCLRKWSVERTCRVVALWHVLDEFFAQHCSKHCSYNNPPPSEIIGVAALAHPDLVIEIVAVAAVPD